MTSRATRFERRLAVAVLEARLAGVHPGWIAWILQHKPDNDQIIMLGTVTEHAELYSKAPKFEASTEQSDERANDD